MVPDVFAKVSDWNTVLQMGICWTSNTLFTLTSNEQTKQTHTMPFRHNLFSVRPESSFRVGLQGKRNKLKRETIWANRSFRKFSDKNFNSQVNRSYKYRSDNEKLQGEIALRKRPGGELYKSDGGNRYTFYELNS